MPSSLFRRRRKPEEQKSGIEPATLVVADASVVVTATIRAQKDARAQSAGGEAGKEKTSVVAPIEQCRQSRNRSAFVLIVSSVFVALATSLLMKQQQRLGGLVPDRISMILTRLERPSFFQQRRKVEEEESIGVVEDASASTPASTSASHAAADEEELAAQAREAAESATAASSGPSGFVTSEEWEEALLLAGGDDGDADATATSALASLEASIRARAGAAARGALLADAASLPWQGVPRRVVLETLRRCPGEVEREPEFFEGGNSAAEGDGDREGGGEEDREGPSSSTASKCPPASSLPRSYPGETAAGAFSALGYETLPLLQSLMAANDFDAAHFASTAAAFFSRTPGHVNALPRRVTAAIVAFEAAAGAGGREETRRAKARAAAEDSAASSAVVKVAPLVARFAGTPRLRSAVAGALAVHQRSSRGGNKGIGGAAAARAAAGAAAAVLERIAVLGESVPLAVAAASRPASPLSDLARSYLREALAAHESGDEREAALLALLLRNAGKGDGGEEGVLSHDGDGGGGSGDLGAWDTAPAALRGALAAALLHPDDFAEAVRCSMLAGGDATARAHLVGALLGAATAVEASGSAGAPASISSRKKGIAPPGDWRPRVDKAVQADAMIHLILHQRGERVPVAMPGERVPGAEQ